MQDVGAIIREFILQNFLFGQTDYLLGAGDSLLEHGIIDSTGVLELVAFLERQFGLSVADQDLVPENLDSILGLTDFVRRKGGCGEGGGGHA